MANYIDKDKLIRDLIDNKSFYPAIVKSAIESQPVIYDDPAIQCICYALGCQEAEKIEKKALEEFLEKVKKWLYKIAFNNVGCKLEGDFSDACEEIISRLDGLKRFVKETREDVVPRSEVEEMVKFKDMAYAELKSLFIEAKQEVANQIFDMVKKRIHNEYNDLSNIVPTDDDYYLGKLAGISEAEFIIAELKKKYIGE